MNRKISHSLTKAAKAGAKGVQKFWNRLTPFQRKNFIRRRSKIQMDKYPAGHPRWIDQGKKAWKTRRLKCA